MRYATFCKVSKCFFSLRHSMLLAECIARPLRRYICTGLNHEIEGLNHPASRIGDRRPPVPRCPPPPRFLFMPCARSSHRFVHQTVKCDTAHVPPLCTPALLSPAAAVVCLNNVLPALYYAAAELGHPSGLLDRVLAASGRL